METTMRKLLLIALAAVVFAIVSPASAQFNGCPAGFCAVGAPSGGGGGTTTWNPADKSAQIVLSNGNLTITNGGSLNLVGGRAIASHSSGKFYFEHTVLATNSNDQLGFGNATESLGSVGQSTNSVGWKFLSGGAVQINGSTIGTAAGGVAVSDVLSAAVDFTGKLIWFRVNAGNWNNSGTANPATGTGGFSLSTLAAGPYFPQADVDGASSSYTSNFGGSTYAQTVPAGFGNW
jgi:hypothetical protein